MPRKNTGNNKRSNRKDKKKKKPLSKKKEQQKKKKEKLEKGKLGKKGTKENLENLNPISEPEEEFKDRRRHYLAIALLNISQLLAEQGDLTWGGIVDPVTYEVVEDYWPGTQIQISEMDRSRINAASSVVFTGEPTIDFEKLRTYVPFMGGDKNKRSK